MPLPKPWVAIAIVVLLIMQAAQIIFIVHRESLTFDEEDHMYAGYRMWTAADYGLNPEHPPLVKLLAALPVLGQKLWTPPPIGIFFKGEAYMGGKLWLQHNDGANQRLVFRMRLATITLALALSLLIFFATRSWFGVPAALIATTFAVFEPNLLAHSGLVTTDLGCALFFLGAIYTFYRYVKQPGWANLVIAGVAAGLLLATKHSGILVGPILPLLAAWEVAVAPTGTRKKLALRLGGACALIAGLSVAVLWSFYGFRYAARPAGMYLIPTLAQYTSELKPLDQKLIGWAASWHILPESYLMGLVDIRAMGKDFNSFLLGNWYPHGVLWYFPTVILIKTTLGMLAALAVTFFALVTGKMNLSIRNGDAEQRDRGRAMVYLLLSGAVFLAVAMVNGLNIGVRHILPVYVVAVILAGAGLAALASRSRGWAWACAVLLVAHIASSLSAFPNPIPYANMAWGGPQNIHLYLSDSNVDWGQELYQVKAWQERHPGEECWFSSFVGGIVSSEMYGIKCHILPNSMAVNTGSPSEEAVPAIVHGSVLLSASEVAGGLWPSKDLNPYRRFQSMKPDEEIDHGILVYRGDISMEDAGGTSRALMVIGKLHHQQTQEALSLAEEAVAIAPNNLYAQWSLGDALAAVGKKVEARAAYMKALEISGHMEPERAAEYARYIQGSVKRL